MAQDNLRRRFAQLIRRVPLLMRVPYTVYRFIQPKYSVGVVGVVLNAQQQVLLVEHVFHPRHPWGLPGGWIGRNEDPSKAVQRELQEELQLKVDASTLLLARVTEHRHMDFAFLCTPHNEPGALSYELFNYGWFSPRRLPKLWPFHYEAIVVALEHQHQTATLPEQAEVR